jgi:hypothetical protein
MSQISALTFFGLQGHKITQREVGLLRCSRKDLPLELVYLDKDIRRAASAISMESSKT